MNVNNLEQRIYFTERRITPLFSKHTFSMSVKPLSLMLFPSRRLRRVLTIPLFSTSPSNRIKSMVLLEMRRADSCSGATIAFNLSITSQLEMLLPGSLSCGRATLMVILAVGLRYKLCSSQRHTASAVSWTMVVIVPQRLMKGIEHSNQREVHINVHKKAIQR